MLFVEGLVKFFFTRRATAQSLLPLQAPRWMLRGTCLGALVVQSAPGGNLTPRQGRAAEKRTQRAGRMIGIGLRAREP